MTLVLTRSDVIELLDMRSCIDAVESILKADAEGRTLGPEIMGTHVGDGGFHIKSAGSRGSPSYYAVKINANFPGNPTLHGLPTIQGVVILFDASDGAPLAVMDSMEITALRTAAASAVAAKYLSATDAKVLCIIGCGVQARAHLFALTAVRRFERILVHDNVAQKAEAFATDFASILKIPIEPMRLVAEAAAVSDVIATCTTGRQQVLDADSLKPGTFLAAVGADNESKRELDPRLLSQSVVIVDSLEQCAKIGELHHALDAGVMSVSDVRASLTDVVSGAVQGRRSESEIIVFDSTGTALQDVAAAALVYGRAVASGRGHQVEIGR
ncbi:MAG TPA: ornithine cyclodeaminase family protein [Gemmatimonadaceae bacterium]|nr:ornithine cyclodeaminase family protein [Gemmatimonadaceae bacterium]